ncbi:hypothetical protein PybrP1_003106, partial [[Pythium] brassicae (nom. inval.)]
GGGGAIVLLLAEFNETFSRARCAQQPDKRRRGLEEGHVKPCRHQHRKGATGSSFGCTNDARRWADDTDQNYVVMAAVSSLMKYVEFVQGVYIAAKTMKVRDMQCTLCRPQPVDEEAAHGPRNNLIAGARPERPWRLDATGARRLRLHYNIPCVRLTVPCNAAAYLSLEDHVLLDNIVRGATSSCSAFLTCTTNICSRSRHEVIEVLLDNPGWFFDVMEQLPNFVDLDRLLVRMLDCTRHRLAGGG